MIVDWENCIWSILRKHGSSGFATGTRKEIPFISKCKEISPELRGTERRRRHIHFLKKFHIQVSHDKLFACETTFLFFDDGFVWRYIHKELLKFIPEFSNDRQCERREVKSTRWNQCMEIPFICSEKIHVCPQYPISHHKNTRFPSDRSFPFFVLFNTCVARFECCDARF